MKKYKSHKTVRAAKIEAIAPQGSSPESYALTLQASRLDNEVVIVSGAWLRKHTPQVDGYLVRYNDGYQSFSPAKAFEEGYTEIPYHKIGFHPLVSALLDFFSFGHLPVELQAASRPFCDLAYDIANRLDGPETTVALRKLLESKDCAVRAVHAMMQRDSEESEVNRGDNPEG